MRSMADRFRAIPMRAKVTRTPRCWPKRSTHLKGRLIQLTIGDKGSYAYASFGAPLAHDDDSLRAVAAALELVQPPAELAFIVDSQIGISRGRIWAGECGARDGAGMPRFTYGVMGNEVNMAARQMPLRRKGQPLQMACSMPKADKL